MTATLKKDLGKAGAWLGEESGGYANSLLRDVLLEVIQGPKDLNAHQDTVAVATIAGMIAKRAGKLTGLRTSVGTCGTADSTTVQVHKNGAAVTGLELSTAHDAADGLKQAVSLATPVAIAAGDLIELVVSAAPTAGEALDATAEVLPDITIET